MRHTSICTYMALSTHATRGVDLPSSRNMLNVHNILEHDSSLRSVLVLSVFPTYADFQSRLDAYFGNNHVFNQTVFDTTKIYFTDEILDPDMMINAKVARQVASRAFNPNYSFTSTTQEFSLGEVAAPAVAFGDLKTGTVNRTLVEYFFGK